MSSSQVYHIVNHKKSNCAYSSFFQLLAAEKIAGKMIQDDRGKRGQPGKSLKGDLLTICILLMSFNSPSISKLVVIFQDIPLCWYLSRNIVSSGSLKLLYFLSMTCNIKFTTYVQNNCCPVKSSMRFTATQKSLLIFDREQLQIASKLWIQSTS